MDRKTTLKNCQASWTKIKNFKYEGLNQNDTKLKRVQFAFQSSVNVKTLHLCECKGEKQDEQNKN